MIFVIIVIVTLTAGIAVGHFFHKKDISIKGIGKIQTVLIFLLLFLMGARLGSDEKLIGSIGSIGVSALVVTMATMAGSLIAIYILRKCLRIDKKGDKTGE